MDPPTTPVSVDVSAYLHNWTFIQVPVTRDPRPRDFSSFVPASFGVGGVSFSFPATRAQAMPRFAIRDINVERIQARSSTAAGGVRAAVAFLQETRQAPRPMSFLNDLLTGVTGPVPARDINAQPQSGLGSFINDFILSATTSRQERAVRGTPRAGDFFKTLTRDVRRPIGGRIGPGSVFGARIMLPGAQAPVGGVSEILQLGLQDVRRRSNLRPVANNLRLVDPSACPPGPQSFPAGTCLLDFQWEDAGGPRGFEMIGRNVDGRAILRKRGRRRRRMGLTKTQMLQVQWACDLPTNCRKPILHGIVHG